MTARTKGSLATGLVIAGILCAGLAFVLGGIGHHAFDRGAVPPRIVSLTGGHEYHLATRGGMPDLTSRGVDLAQSKCTVIDDAQVVHPLAVAPEAADTRAVHVIGRFISPVSGRVHVECESVGQVFVDDAESATVDAAGGLVLASTLLLIIGATMALSALYRVGAVGVVDDFGSVGDS